MTEFLFPDNTVLCNFGVVDRLDLLKSVLDGRGRWTEAVEYEAWRSSRFIPSMAGLLADGMLGEAIEVAEEPDVRNIELIRRAVFGGTEDKPLRHLGEAQTCYVIENWGEFDGSWWISDDRESLRYARRRGIATRETIDLVRIAVANGDLDGDAAYALMMEMAAKKRKLRMLSSADDLLS
jgi:hypothetical protein